MASGTPPSLKSIILLGRWHQRTTSSRSHGLIPTQWRIQRGRRSPISDRLILKKLGILFPPPPQSKKIGSATEVLKHRNVLKDGQGGEGCPSGFHSAESRPLGPVVLTAGVVLGPVLNLPKSIQTNCDNPDKRWQPGIGINEPFRNPQQILFPGLTNNQVLHYNGLLESQVRCITSRRSRKLYPVKFLNLADSSWKSYGNRHLTIRSIQCKTRW